MKLKNIQVVFLFIILSYIIMIGCKTKVKKLHRIYTKDNRFNIKGKPFILRGVSIGDPYFLEKEDEHFEEKAFSELVKWNINVVRIPIHPGAWQAEKDFSAKYLDKIIEWSRK